MNTLIGNVCLNTAFVLYLLVYLPQIIHNHQSNHIANLSLKMHFIFYSAYLLDLFYGFSCHLQWQYRIVSIIGVTLLTVQHLQITHHYWTNNKQKWFNLLFLLLAGMSVLYFFTIAHSVYSDPTTLSIGYVSRLGFLMYTLPQIAKNKRLQSTDANSIQFVYLNLTLSVLDLIAAWCLNWGWPNKLGSPIMVCLMVIMLMQTRKYRPTTQMPLSAQTLG